MAARHTPNPQWSYWLRFLDGKLHHVSLMNMTPDHLTWRRGLYQAAHRGGIKVTTRTNGSVMAIQARRNEQ